MFKIKRIRGMNIYIQILLHVNQGETLSEQDMFIHIITSRDKDIVVNVANFIHKAFIKRNEHIAKKE